MKKNYTTPDIDINVISAQDILLNSFDKDPYAQDLTSWEINKQN